MQPFFACVLAIGLVASTLTAPAPAADAPIPGFSAAGAITERAREAAFDALLQPEDQRTWMRRLTARPHHVGSPYDADNARYLQSLLASFGYDAKIERFEVLFPTPTRRLLELTGPGHFTAALRETPLASDPTSGQESEQLPLYNAYSRDGDVRGALVYVNYGSPRDYDELARHGIDVRGKIVIARYGESWRGIKPKVAAEHGALGCIIYSDPHDDGYWQGDPYPAGVERNPTSGQRGSVADIPTYPGDPSSPGVGSVPGVAHLPLDRIATLTKIPVLPISATDAAPLLAALAGPVAPPSWRGALPFTYHLGAGPAQVHLALQFDWRIRPIYDVIATLRGAQRPDQWVIRGNHHDAWVNGAEDPIAGAVALLAEAKAVGELARRGDVPRRTIVYTLWDGEEPGLLGSTAWVETHQAELTAKAAIYVNTDTNDRGYLFVEGSHSLQAAVSGVADDVVDPERNVAVKARVLAGQRVAAEAGHAAAGGDGSAYAIGALGSGSDFSAFVDHAGVATLNLGYGGEDDSGSYHSIFDSFAEFTTLKDGRNFAYGVTLAKTAGRIVLRFADSAVLPYRFGPSATTIAGYATGVERLLTDERTATATRSGLLATGAYVAASDPRTVYVPPTPWPDVPQLRFAALDAAVAAVQSSAAAYDARAESYAAPGYPELDALLIATEKALLGDGLPRRPWYRHELYAPGFYTGYGVKTMPAIREAIEERDWPGAQSGIASVSAALRRYAAAIDAATAALNRSARRRPS